jgi:hypothetical protein
MQISWRTLFAIAAFGVTCRPHPGVIAPLDRDFELGVGAQGQVVDSPVRVKFLQVIEDSRCPTDVVCVWQGNGKARVTVDSAGATLAAELNTSLQPRTMAAFGYVLELRELRPARNSKTSIAPADYIAVFRVTRS